MQTAGDRRASLCGAYVLILTNRVGLGAVTLVANNKVCHAEIAKQKIAAVPLSISYRHIKKAVLELDVAMYDLNVVVQVAHSRC